ncbi:NAD(P)-dependent oxidoreductase [Ferrimonas gelatinilytica]|uniref:NAD(P)-dependent oxidoreductase n=1 Tax=Ferrimonas gelatinilytica TaxID=1255257 RepID=A0ABP9RUE2_9GAMM
MVIAAKSDTPHPKLSGTIHSVAREVEEAGGQAMAVKLDVRDEKEVQSAMAQAVDRFGGLDVLVNNASAIALTPVQHTDIDRFDLIHSVNTRGTLVCSKAAIPYLKQTENAQILTLSPPINLAPHWLGPYGPYTVTKYGMTLLTLGLAEELKGDGVRCNCLWPQTTIATAAVEYAIDAALLKRSRTPAIMADAAMAILTSEEASLTGQCLTDEQVLRDSGVVDFEPYKVDPACEHLMRDLYLDR